MDCRLRCRPACRGRSFSPASARGTRGIWAWIQALKRQAILVPSPACGGFSDWVFAHGQHGGGGFCARERDRGPIGQKRAVNRALSAACRRLTPVAAGCRRTFWVCLFFWSVCPCALVSLRKTQSCAGHGGVCTQALKPAVDQKSRVRDGRFAEGKEYQQSGGMDLRRLV